MTLVEACDAYDQAQQDMRAASALLLDSCLERAAKARLIIEADVKDAMTWLHGAILMGSDPLRDAVARLIYFNTWFVLREGWRRDY